MRKYLPLLIVLGVAIWSVWPCLPAGRRLTMNCVADYGRDGWLIGWIENSWQKKYTDYIRSGGANISNLFAGNILYPYKRVMAYTSMLLLSGLIGWNGPGMVMVTGQVVTMVVTYWWFKKMGGNRWGAAVGAVAFGLARARWEYQVHMQIWSMQYWLVGAGLVCSWIETKKNWQLITGAAILGLQMWEEPLGIYFAALLITAKLFTNSKFLIPIHLLFSNYKTIITGGIVFGLVAFLPAREYWRVSQEFNFVRGIRDAAHHGLSVNGMGRFYSPGMAVLFVYVLIKIIKSQITNLKSQTNHKLQIPNYKWLVLVLVSSLVLSLGPVVKWNDKTVKIGGKIPIPLPYAAAYYLVPGMQAFRVPSRWMMVAAWSVGGLIVITFSNSQITNLKSQQNFKFQKRFASRANFKFKYCIGILGCLVVAILGGERLTKYKILPTPAEFPKVYQWLKNQPGQVIAELPTGNENLEAERMWYSTWHEKKLLGGYTGFIPPERAKLLDQLNKDPYGRGTIDKLRETGVDYIISHDLRFMNYDLRIVYDDGESRVYEL